MDDASVAASSTRRLRIWGRVGVIAARQPVALGAQRERVWCPQAEACVGVWAPNTGAFPEPKAEDSTQEPSVEGEGCRGAAGLRTGGFQKQAPRRRPTPECVSSGNAKGSKGKEGLQAGGFQQEPPRRSTTTYAEFHVEWLGSWWRWLLAHAAIRSVSGGQHAGITWEDLTRDE